MKDIFLQLEDIFLQLKDIFSQLKDIFLCVPTLLGIAFRELEAARPREAARQQFP